MGFKAEVIAKSIGPAGQLLETTALRYPRIIHAEFMTHREFSRNASSSRAIPVAKVIEQVRNDPAMPVHWGTNKPGMQAGVELEGPERIQAIELWLKAAEEAANTAERMMDMGLHKQVANRILEPFQWMHTLVTTVSKSNWNGLRLHPDADPTIYELARVWDVASRAAIPSHLGLGDWHLPYVGEDDRQAAYNHLKVGRITRDEPWDHQILAVLKMVSAARCARVSYLNHMGRVTTIEEDIDLYKRLVRSEIIHASPTEHQATPDYQIGPDMVEPRPRWSQSYLHGNLPGWIQHRKQLDREYIR